MMFSTMFSTPRLQHVYIKTAVFTRSLRHGARDTRKHLRPLQASSASDSHSREISFVPLADGSIYNSVRRLVECSVKSTFPQYENIIDVTECTNPALGDYQSSSALQIFSAMRRKGDTKFSSPRDVAEVIVAGIADTHVFESISVAGPGFINLKLSQEFISSAFFNMNRDVDRPVKPHVVVDFSSPNIAKEMHVGHLRSTIIGDVLCNIFEHVGYKVTRLNHVGDWGTQFGMLIQYMKDNSISAPLNASNLQEYYKQAKRKFDLDEQFKKRAQEEVVKLQKYDSDTIAEWEKICQISREEFQTIYDRLDIRIVERGESFYNKMIPQVLDELETGGFVIEDKGALCIFNDEDETPVICRKSDGGFNYASTDLAAVRYRIMHEKADEIIYVTDLGQLKHFDAIFKTAIAAGWGDPRKVKLKHVGFGVVLGEDGKRLRTRSGDTIKLKDLLDEAENRCEKFLRDKGSSLSLAEIQHAAKVLGTSSVKYADLHNNRLTNYTFSFDRMLDLKGNTAMYLQYSHARVAAVLERARSQPGKQNQREIRIINTSERMLALHLLKFDDAIAATVADLLPSRICEYVFNLCTLFNNFYAECKVLGGENEQSRIHLCEQTQTTLKLAFSLLGMTPLEKI